VQFKFYLKIYQYIHLSITQELSIIFEYVHFD